MKKLGIIGGLGYLSTVEYYKKINDIYRSTKGNYDTVDMLIRSFNEGEFDRLQKQDSSEKLCEEMILNGFADLVNAGCNAFAISCNGGHRFQEAIYAKFDLKLIHIVDSVVESCLENGYKKIAIFGVMKTMNGDFYKEILDEHGIDIVPIESTDKDLIHNKIYDELLLDIFNSETKELFKNLCKKYHNKGADAIVLGCTEIPLLLPEECIDGLPILSTTKLHCHHIVKYLLS